MDNTNNRKQMDVVGRLLTTRCLLEMISQDCVAVAPQYREQVLKLAEEVKAIQLDLDTNA